MPNNKQKQCKFTHLASSEAMRFAEEQSHTALRTAGLICEFRRPETRKGVKIFQLLKKPNKKLNV